jgi:flagellar hook protein FlgE
MGLTSALFTGVSGLDANQTWLNVIGNNVANSNTTAFKSSMVEFSPQFYVTDQQSTAPTTNFGGTNPNQEGLGTSIESIRKNFSAGNIQATGQNTDMAIDGSGFFVVKGQNQQLYTRNGAFTLNSSDQLVNAEGDFVQGYGVDSNQNIQSGALQNITIPLGETQIAKATQNATLQGNLDSSGVAATGASVLLSGNLTTVGGTAAPTSASLMTNLALPASSATPAFTAGETITVSGTKGGRTVPPSTFTVGAASTVQDFQTFLQQNMGIDTAAPDTPPPGVTLQAGTSANTSQLVITGNTGTENALALSGTSITTSTGTSPLSFAGGTDAAGYTDNPTGESTFTSFTAYDSLGTPITVNLTAVLESKSTAGNTWRFYADSPNSSTGGFNVGSGTLTFGSDGSLMSSTGTTLSVSRAGTGAVDPMTINLNFGSMTQLSGQSSNQVVSTQDGFAAGTLNTFSVGTDGIINGAYSNGQTRVLGQVALATFNNPLGLQDQGSDLYAAAPASGEPQLGTPGALGSGTLQGSSLEQSNVDLSTEFTNMIVASTGFSAASKVITTSDQLIQELLNSTH